MGKVRSKEEKFLRKHRLAFLFNDLEQNALESYCKKYKISNRSKFIREAIVTTILEKFDKDYPSLFEEFEKKKQPTYVQTELVF